MKRTIVILLGLLVLSGGIFAQNKGALVIQCNVSGAQVLVNGRLVGNTTPNFSMLLPPGPYKVTVRKQNYPDYNNSINLTAAGVTLQVILGGGNAVVPGPAPNQVDNNASGGQRLVNNNYGLTINSNVNGATVFINGNQAGQTPFSAQVPSGSYTVLVRAPGFLDYNQSIVVGNGPAQVNAMLQGQNQQLSVQANVNGATVFINGNQAGQTPFSAQVPSGTYTVLVRAPGYLDFNQSVVVGNGPAQVNAMLQGQNQQLSVQANVNGATVFINGNQAGQTPFAAQVPSGSYAVVVRAPGFLDFNQSVVVGNGPALVSAMLQPMTATWQFDLPDNMRNRDFKPDQNRDAFQIWIDGVMQPSAPGRLGASGQLLPGRHVIRLVSGGMSTETQIDVQAGKAYIFEPYIGLNVK